MLRIAQQETNQSHRGFGQQGLPTHRQRRLHVLIVDADLAGVELCLQELKRAQFAMSADVVQTRADFIAKLQKE